MKKIIVMIMVLSGQLAFGMDVPRAVPLEASSTSDMKKSELFKAVETGNLPQVEALLNQGVDVNAELNGITLLFVAGHGPVEVARLLLDHGADINAVSSVGGIGGPRHTVLGRAAAVGNFGVVLELLTFIPLAERKAIRENVLGLLTALKRKGEELGKKMPRDIRQLVGQEEINRLAQQLMPRVLERARLLLSANDAYISTGTTRELMLRLRHQAAAGNLRIMGQLSNMGHANDYQAIADLLDLDSPASQAILLRQVAANIKRIAANPLPAFPEQSAQPKRWYQRAKEKAQSFLKKK